VCVLQLQTTPHHSIVVVDACVYNVKEAVSVCVFVCVCVCVVCARARARVCVCVLEAVKTKPVGGR